MMAVSSSGARDAVVSLAATLKEGLRLHDSPPLSNTDSVYNNKNTNNNHSTTNNSSNNTSTNNNTSNTNNSNNTSTTYSNNTNTNGTITNNTNNTSINIRSSHNNTSNMKRGTRDSSPCTVSSKRVGSVNGPRASGESSVMAGRAKLLPRQDHLSWEEYFMAVAFLSAKRSKDPVSQVGACIVNQRNQVVGIGYNGMPRGCHDKDMPWGKESEKPHENKYMYVCHAELNAILNKNSADVSGCTIYVALFPCNECAKLIIQAGISNIVYYSDKHWKKLSTKASKKMLDMTKISYRKYDSGRRKLTLDFDAVKAVFPEVSASGKGALVTGTDNDIHHRPGTEFPRPLDQYISWEEYFMAVAFLSAQRSKDPISQVGACIVNTDKRIVAIGYNGMPTGCADESMPWEDSHQDDEHNKNYYVCHAELNAIMNKNGADVRECTMHVTLFPCNECAKLISQAGLSQVVYYTSEGVSGSSMKAAKDILKRAQVTVTQFSEEYRTRIPIDFQSIEKK